jgi:multidrug resistance efflux pump
VHRIGEEIAAAKQGIFVAADRNDVPYSQQRLDEFRVRKAETEAQATTLAARLAELDRQVLTERVRAAGLAATELTAPVSGVVWRPAVFAGAPVARNAELLALIDCSEIYATATFSGRAFDDLHPGRQAIVHILGTDANYPATVVDARALQGTNVEERFAAPLPKLGDRQILAVLRLDSPKALAAEKYCNVGRRVEVRFQDRPPFRFWSSF